VIADIERRWKREVGKERWAELNEALAELVSR
jgi:hypothetical protein